jgi:hypothetical protein
MLFKLGAPSDNNDMQEIDANAPLGYDASDPDQVAEAADGARRAARRDANTLKAFLGTPHGRAWMYRLLVSCHIYQTSFDGDPMRMAFREGERNIGLRLLAESQNADPDLFALMLKEQGND